MGKTVGAGACPRDGEKRGETGLRNSGMWDCHPTGSGRSGGGAEELISEAITWGDT